MVSDPFDANSFHDAEAKAHRALAPSLSNWAVHLDIPLSVVQVESVEVRTGNTQTGILTPHFVVPLAIRSSRIIAAYAYRPATLARSPEPFYLTSTHAGRRRTKSS